MKKSLRFGAISRWDEGIPLGNGRLGALVYGVEKPVVSLDKGDLWDLSPAPEWNETGFSYAHLVDLVQSGKSEDFQESCRLFDACYDHLTPSKIKAGRLEIDMPLGEHSSFDWDYEKGLAQVKGEAGSFSLFLSHERGIGVLSFDKETPFSFVPSPALFAVKKGLGYPPSASEMSVLSKSPRFFLRRDSPLPSLC
jgi:hypothetical protein